MCAEGTLRKHIWGSNNNSNNNGNNPTKSHSSNSVQIFDSNSKFELWFGQSENFISQSLFRWGEGEWESGGERERKRNSYFFFLFQFVFQFRFGLPNLDQSVCRLLRYLPHFIWVLYSPTSMSTLPPLARNPLRATSSHHLWLPSVCALCSLFLSAAYLAL